MTWRHLLPPQQRRLTCAFARPLDLQAMEGLVREGLVRSIGVSNWGTRKLAELLSYAQMPPAVCQVGG